AEATMALAEEIQQARDRLPQVMVTDEARSLGLSLVTALQIESSRAEITLFEAARAHAAADERTAVTPDDVRAV
ncbi:MAG TPA: magnesium chelatase, partial [Chloroflexota bacterium]|nr:magnesium chelatase [Chloroflexota bacterium]